MTANARMLLSAFWEIVAWMRSADWG